MKKTQAVDLEKLQKKALEEAVKLSEEREPKKNRVSKTEVLLALRPFLVMARKLGMSYSQVREEVRKRFKVNVSEKTLQKAYRLIRQEELEKLYEAVERKIETDDKDIVDFNFAKIARSKGFTKEEVRDFLLVERTDTRKGEKLLEYVNRTVERAWSTTQ